MSRNNRAGTAARAREIFGALSIEYAHAGGVVNGAVLRSLARVLAVENVADPVKQAESISRLRAMLPAPAAPEAADTNPPWIALLSEPEYALLVALYHAGEALLAARTAGVEPDWQATHGKVERAVLAFPLASLGYMSVAQHAAATKATARNELWASRAETERQRRAAAEELAAMRLGASQAATGQGAPLAANTETAQQGSSGPGGQLGLTADVPAAPVAGIKAGVGGVPEFSAEVVALRPLDDQAAWRVRQANAEANAERALQEHGLAPLEDGLRHTRCRER